MTSLPLLTDNDLIVDILNKTNDIIINTDDLISTRAANNHNHDTRYFTKSDFNDALSEAELLPHTHTISEFTDASELGGIIASSPSSVSVKSILELTVEDIGLENTNNTSDLNKPVSNLLQSALDLKANINSPAFIGIPIANTPPTSTNTTQIATTKYVKDNAALLPSAAEASLNEVWAGTSGKYVSPQKALLSQLPVDQVIVYDYTGNNLVSRQASLVNSWNSVCYGRPPESEGIFVAVSQEGNVMTSPDGITWTSRTTPQSNQWMSVCYGNGLFVAVATSGTNRVMTSPDGITWTARTHAQANTWYSVCYGTPGGNPLFVAVSYDGTNRVMTSPDGITWTVRSVPNTATWTSVCYGTPGGNPLFVAVSEGGSTRAMTSPDGITWTNRTAPSENNWTSVCYGTPGENPLFVAAATSGTNRVMTSPDGITWTARTISTTAPRSVCYGEGLFFLTAGSGTPKFMKSLDGINWSTASNYGDAWLSSCYGKSKFVSVSYSNYPDRVVTFTPEIYYQINFNNGRIFNLPLDDSISSVKLQVPLNMKIGATGKIFLNSTTISKKTVLFNNVWKLSQDSIEISGINSRVVISYYVQDSSNIICTFNESNI